MDRAAERSRAPIDGIRAAVGVAVGSAAVGVGAGVGGRPFYLWSYSREQMGAGASMRGVYENIAKYGVSGWFYGWEVAMVRGGWKRAIKGTTYVVTDDMSLNAWQKALVSSALITVATTPVDRIAAAYGRNREGATLSGVVYRIRAGGLPSFYRGGVMDFSKNGVEAALVYGFNELRKEVRRYYGMSESETNIWEWLGMTFGGATMKGLATNWMEVSKVEIQGELAIGGKALGVRDVYRIRGSWYFFLSGFGARYVVGLMTMAGNYGALLVNDWCRGRG